MAEFFVRRTTAFLIFLVMVLSCAIVGLAVYSFSDKSETETTFTETVVPEKLTTDDVTVTEEPDRRTQPWELEYRIPVSTIPYHYDLYLHPDLESGKFTGKVTILVGVTSPMTFLVTHFRDMNITLTKLRSAESSDEVDLLDYFGYEPNQFWVMRPRVALKPGNYSMELEFDGSLENKIVGFYKSIYTTKAGIQRSIATSKFQPTDARAAFPCFDEPSFKSTFSLTIVRPTQGYTALSNMPEQGQVANAPLRGLTEVTFQKSVPMVTYLVCFIVCDFEYVETKTQENKLFRVYSTPDQIERTHYARNIGVSILNYFENYFEVEYPLPKQDMIAIPDFVSGAMEHWGLITYRETNLLYDEVGSSSYNQQRVASVVSHELAHMWFGNLMTLKWWDDLWLNEGFASYVEYKGVAQYHQDWDMLGQFVVDDLQPVFKLDAKLSSHPIIQPVAHPNQITEIFDAISYSKGAAVLRMLDNFMGEEQFRVGVRNFLRQYKYANAVTSDLWRHLAQQSSLDISAIMDTWTKQMGYPVLMVNRTSPSELKVQQSRFLQDPSAVSGDDSPYGYKWDVPVTYKAEGAERQLQWLYRDMPSLTLEVPGASPWVKINVDQYGFYRVNYDAAMWNELVNLLQNKHEALSPPDRSSLLDDAFSLAAANQLEYSVALRLCSYLDKETHYIPWRTVTSHLSALDRLLRNTKAYPLYKNYVLKLVESHARAHGWEDSGNHLKRRLRPVLLALACQSGSAWCLSAAETKLKEWLLDPSHSLPPNLRTVVYKYGMKNAGYSDWELMLERYAKELNAQEKSKLIAGLTNVNTRWIIHRFLDATRNASVVRTQDYLSSLGQLAANPAATDIVWSFIKSEWDWLVSRFTLSSRYLGNTVKSVVSLFTTPLLLSDAEQFFASEPEAGAGERARKQALEEVRRNIGWLSRNTDTLYDWLLLQ